VLGDCGLSAARFLGRRGPDRAGEELDRFTTTIGLPVKCLHVIRNPFDTIAMEPSLATAFERDAATIHALRPKLGENLLDVYYEELLADPKKELRRIFGFLELGIDEDYLARTTACLRPAPRARRTEVSWTEPAQRRIEQTAGKYECYERYAAPGDLVAAGATPKLTEPGATRELIVSGRNIGPEHDVLATLHSRYRGFGGSIRSVYGFVWGMPSPLYGGRGYHEHNALSPGQVATLREHGVFLYLSLSNHFFCGEDYEKTKALLDAYHEDGNGIICVNDELAEAIRNDYPRYTLEASMIKNIKTLEGIEQALTLYDLVTLRMTQNDDVELLQAIPDKHRIVLFANSKCEYHCEMPCLQPFSQRMKAKQETRLRCWRKEKGLPIAPYMEFELEDARFDGFTLFKLEPEYVDHTVGL